MVQLHLIFRYGRRLRVVLVEYLRLHKLDYTLDGLGEWAKRVAEQKWNDAYIYFKHDEGEGSGPPAVEAFVKALPTAL